MGPWRRQSRKCARSSSPSRCFSPQDRRSSRTSRGPVEHRPGRLKKAPGRVSIFCGKACGASCRSILELGRGGGECEPRIVGLRIDLRLAHDQLLSIGGSLESGVYGERDEDPGNFLVVAKIRFSLDLRPMFGALAQEPDLQKMIRV